MHWYNKSITSISIFLFLSCSSQKDVVVPTIATSTQTTNEELTADSVSDNTNSDTIQDTLPDNNMSHFHEHKKWTDLLQKHVDNNGWVDYKGFINDSTALDSYLMDLAANHPTDSWQTNQAKAYWINAYNAFTVKLIADNYPLKSIKELGGDIFMVNTTWDIKFINLGDKTYDLNNLEHGILRDDFSDGRLHAALNCASVSCPPLRNEAFTANKLETQLNEQMGAFINGKKRNIISASSPKVSSLFKWFSGDFKKDAGSVISFINLYSDVKINAKAKLNYMSYNWNLNEKKNSPW